MPVKQSVKWKTDGHRSSTFFSSMQSRFDVVKQQIQTIRSDNSSDQFYAMCGLTLLKFSTLNFSPYLHLQFDK